MLLMAVCVFAALSCSAGARVASRRSSRTVEACLRSERIPTKPVPRGTTLLDSLNPRPVTLLDVDGDNGALIAIYASVAVAAKRVRQLQGGLPVVQHDNVLVATLVSPQPSRAARYRIYTCAFGPGARPSRSPLVGAPGTSTPPPGRQEPRA
jgi:hypothetical protein